MSNFIDDNLSLPWPKTDLIAVPIGADATKYVAAVDWNAAMLALADIQAYLRGASVLFGDGSDGNATLDGSTTVLGMVPSGGVYTQTRDMFYDSLTINSGVVLKPAGTRVFGRTQIVGPGKISGTGKPGVLGVAGTSVAGVTLPTNCAGGTTVPESGLVVPRGYTGTGGNGGSSSAAGGSAGGSVGSFPPAADGDLGLALLAIWAATMGNGQLKILGGRTGGGGGGAGAPGVGGWSQGAGGASGRYLVVSAAVLAANLTIENNGGKGGDAVAGAGNFFAGGGGGGSGGYSVIVRGSVASAPTCTATGGAIGAAAGAGSTGATPGSDGVVRFYTVGR